MFTQKQIKKMEKNINESFSFANKKFNKYNVEWKGSEFEPFSLYLGTGAYVRMSNRPENGSIVVASIELREEDQGKGYFKDFYALLENIANKKDCQIVFESVLNEKLFSYLEDKGYTNHMNSGTFYKHFGPTADMRVAEEKKELENYLEKFHISSDPKLK